MSVSVSFRKFVTEPMSDKLVSEIPGVGPVTADRLKSIGHSKAVDLYNRLERLNFDEKKFAVWMTLNCKGAKVTLMYKALIKWHEQTGELQNNDDSGSERAVNSRARQTSRARAVFSVPRRQPRHNVQFDLSETERDNNSPVNVAPGSKNPLELFFSSFSDSCKNISPEFHTEFKMAILNVVGQFERRSRERQSEVMLSTSRATNGDA